MFQMSVFLILFPRHLERQQLFSIISAKISQLNQSARVLDNELVIAHMQYLLHVKVRKIRIRWEHLNLGAKSGRQTLSEEVLLLRIVVR